MFNFSLWLIRVLTDFHLVLPQPNESFHGLSTGVRILLAVAGGVGYVLLGGGIVVMTQDFFDDGCCLGESHIVQVSERIKCTI